MAGLGRGRNIRNLAVSWKTWRASQFTTFTRIIAGRKSMGRSRRLKLRQHWKRGLVSLALLVSVCASLFPLPVGWDRRSEKDLSTPFPCQNRPCGCRTADQCWKKCCCFTDSQKVAWAKAQRVRVPEAVVISAKLECAQSEQQKRGCCRVATSKAPQADARSRVANAEERHETIYVIASLAQQCQGQPWSWSTLPWAILPQVSECRSFSLFPCEKIVLISASSMKFCLRPPVPPPRRPSDCQFPV
jgi:hypothetical protein